MRGNEGGGRERGQEIREMVSEWCKKCELCVHMREGSLEAPSAEIDAAKLVDSLQLLLINTVRVRQESSEWAAL